MPIIIITSFHQHTSCEISRPHNFLSTCSYFIYTTFLPSSSQFLVTSYYAYYMHNLFVLPRQMVQTQTEIVPIPQDSTTLHNLTDIVGLRSFRLSKYLQRNFPAQNFNSLQFSTTKFVVNIAWRLVYAIRNISYGW